MTRPNVPDLFASDSDHNPGGNRTISVPTSIKATATFGGENREYRYRLTRRWGPGPTALVVMMNPSMADMTVDDPTVAKMRRMVLGWPGGPYGCLMVGNVFAYRATDQARLAAVTDPVGPENDQHLLAMAREAAIVVFAYGAPKVRRLRGQGLIVARMMISAGVRPHVLRLGKDGHPWHPLYLPDATVPVPWEPVCENPKDYPQP